MNLICENVSKADVETGDHLNPVDNQVVLIQIKDLKDTFCIPKHAADFVKIVQLSFEDTEDSTASGCITEVDAQKIVTTLLWASQSNCHVVVHCHAGIARSGAVVEFATRLGFTALDHRWRWPNTLVLAQLDYFFRIHGNSA